MQECRRRSTSTSYQTSFCATMPPVTLRELPKADRTFWQQEYAQQAAQAVFDQNADYIRRALPRNEIDTLSLNEVAAHDRRGFYFHLPSILSWRTPPSTRMPAARLPRQPEWVAEWQNLDPGLALTSNSLNYPTMLYMAFAWSDDSVAAFSHESHRARYLRSSALCSLPPSDTPLFAIQYAVQRTPLYLTEHPSLVLLAAHDAYYLATTSELAAILGTSKNEPHKLQSANWLWDRASLDKGRDNRRAKDASMAAFRHATLDTVHSAIALYRRNGLVETFHAGLMHSYIPRPDPNMPAIGQALGGLISSDPPSRRGERHRSAKRRRSDDRDGDNGDTSAD